MSSLIWHAQVATYKVHTVERPASDGWLCACPCLLHSRRLPASQPPPTPTTAPESREAEPASMPSAALRSPQGSCTALGAASSPAEAAVSMFAAAAGTPWAAPPSDISSDLMVNRNVAYFSG